MELEKSSSWKDLKIISNDINLDPISWELNTENQLFNICVGVWVSGQHAANFSHLYKSAHENSSSFDKNVVVVGDGPNMVLIEKPTKNWKLRGLKLRGKSQNQISTPRFIDENDHDNEINIFVDFENEITMHMGTAYAISKIEQNFQNRILRQLSQSFEIPSISMIHWISSNFLN